MKGNLLRKTTFALALAVIYVVGCSRSQPEDKRVVRVNDVYITESQVEQTAEMLRQGLAQYSPEQTMGGVTDELRATAVRQMIANELMLDEAQQRGIRIEGPVFDSLYKSFRGGVDDEAGFTRMLTAQGVTEEQFKEQVKEGMALDSLMKMLLEDADTVSEQSAREFYNTNPALFSSSRAIRGSQIVFLFNGDTTAKQKAALRQKARDVHRELQAGAQFDEMARQHSMGPAARSGGDIGWATVRDMRPDIRKALDGIDKGGISEVIETDFGFVILKKTGVKDGKARAFDEVKERITANLEMRNRNDRIAVIIDSLIARADIDYLDSTYAPAN
jgi:parvulin-like peptidyl-prolyl isomerase